MRYITQLGTMLNDIVNWAYLHSDSRKVQAIRQSTGEPSSHQHAQANSKGAEGPG